MPTPDSRFCFIFATGLSCPSVGVRSCIVSFAGERGVRHSVEVTADTLYEAAATALSIFKQSEWVVRRLVRYTELLVAVKNPEAMHRPPVSGHALLSSTNASTFVSYQVGRQLRHPSSSRLRRRRRSGYRSLSSRYRHLGRAAVEHELLKLRQLSMGRRYRHPGADRLRWGWQGRYRNLSTGDGATWDAFFVDDQFNDCTLASSGVSAPTSQGPKRP